MFFACVHPSDVEVNDDYYPLQIPIIDVRLSYLPESFCILCGEGTPITVKFQYSAMFGTLVNEFSRLLDVIHHILQLLLFLDLHYITINLAVNPLS